MPTSPPGPGSTSRSSPLSVSRIRTARMGRHRIMLMAGTPVLAPVVGSAASVAGRLLGRVGRSFARRLEADLDHRDPDFIREQLPMSWLLSTLWFRGEVRNLAQDPRAGTGAPRRQSLRRQPDARHDRLHARLQRLLRGRAAVLPARPQPRARIPRRAIPPPVRHGQRVPRARERGARGRRGGPRLSRRRLGGPPARAGRAARSTSTGAKVSSSWR